MLGIRHVLQLTVKSSEVKLIVCVVLKQVLFQRTMIQLEFDSVISGNSNSNNISSSTSALTDSNSFSTPFSVKDILNFVDQSEQQQIVGNVDCGPIVGNGLTSTFGASSSPTNTMDYCDNRNTSVDSPQSSYLSYHHHHHHHPAATTHYYHSHGGSVPGATSPQFGYSELCDYNANYYAAPYANPNSYYGQGYPPYTAPGTVNQSANSHRESQQLSSEAEVAVKSSPVDYNQQHQMITPSKSTSSTTSLLSPHAQQLDTMCQELSTEDNESRSRKLKETTE